MKSHKPTLLAVIFCLSLTAFGQKFIEKPYQKWSKEDAIRVLNDSPWSQQYQSTSGSAAAAQAQTAREQADQRIVGRNVPTGPISRGMTPPVTIRLHSALPVRQAIVRMQQLSVNYDRLSEGEQTKFNDSAKGFLNCAICQSYYVVTMLKAKDTSGQTVEDGIFQTMTLEDVKGKVWLMNEKGEKREIAQFTPPKGAGDAAVFFFKRTDDSGATLVTPETKSLKFVFSNEFLGSQNPYSGLVPRNFEFKVSKMLMGDKIEF